MHILHTTLFIYVTYFVHTTSYSTCFNIYTVLLHIWIQVFEEMQGNISLQK